MRLEFSGQTAIQETRQREHDLRLVEYLENAIAFVDQAMQKADETNPSLEFRQSELLWELGSAKALLSLDDQQKTAETASRALKARALKMAQHVEAAFPKFDKRPQ